MRRIAGLLAVVVAGGVGVTGQGTTPRPAAPVAVSAAPAPVPAQAPRPTPRSAAPTPMTAHAPAAGAGPDVAAQTQLVKEYCATCHSDRGKAGGLSLAGFDAAQLLDHTPVAEKIIRKLRAGMMPPATARKPAPEVLA
jgi:mono/diheme cytochrome c family protein